MHHRQLTRLSALLGSLNGDFANGLSGWPNVALTSAVPEPTMALLALLGLGGWGVMRRRQG